MGKCIFLQIRRELFCICWCGYLLHLGCFHLSVEPQWRVFTNYFPLFCFASAPTYLDKKRMALLVYKSNHNTVLNFTIIFLLFITKLSSLPKVDLALHDLFFALLFLGLFSSSGNMTWVYFLLTLQLHQRCNSYPACTLGDAFLLSPVIYIL